jgi:hypothetical protein
MHGCLAICHARTQNDVSELRFIDAIWIVFAFQTKRRVLAITLARFSRQRAVELNAGVKLQARFGAGNFHHATAVRIKKFGNGRKL